MHPLSLSLCELDISSLDPFLSHSHTHPLSLSLSLSLSLPKTVNQDVPAEFQRILNTVADLDHRVSKTRDAIQEKVNECLELPGLHSRGLSKDNETKILKLRKDIDESHEHVEMLS